MNLQHLCKSKDICRVLTGAGLYECRSLFRDASFNREYIREGIGQVGIDLLYRSGDRKGIGALSGNDTAGAAGGDEFGPGRCEELQRQLLTRRFGKGIGHAEVTE